MVNFNWKKYLLMLFLLLAKNGFSSDISKEANAAKRTVRKFVVKGDTTGLDKSLEFIDGHFAESNDPTLLALMLQVSAKEAKIDRQSLKKLYFIIRKFYETATTKTKNFEYSLKIYKILRQTDDYEGLMWILIDIGNIFYTELDYEQAYQFYGKAERAAHKAKSNYGLSIVYLNYGMIDERRGQHKEALEHYRTSSRYRLKSENVKIASSTYIKMALTFLNLNQADSCLHYIHLTEAYYYNKGEKTPLVIDMPFNINYVYGEYFMRQKRFDQAIYHIRKARRYCKEKNLMSEGIAANAFETDFLFKAKRYKEAAACAQEMLPLFKQYGLLDQQKYVYRMLKKSYSELKEYEKSHFAAQNYVLIDDSIHNLHVRSELNMIRSIAAVYESEGKLHKIRKNLQIATVKNSLRTKQRMASLLIAVSSFVCVLILGGMLLNSRANKKRLLLLHEQLVQKNNEVKFNSAELKRSNQLKDNLFSIISNDLRNPLHRLLDELNVVKSAIREKQLTAPIENTLKETITLFESLLQWSKTGKKQNIFRPVKVNLDENINKIILFYLPEIQAREIKIINKSSAISTYADQNILQTLLRNLLGNAIVAVSKNDANSIIEIDTNLLDDQHIEIIVSDSGPGFPQEILEKFRDEQFDVNVKSKGLGLSISKALAKMSGWKMEISNGGRLGGAQISIVVSLFRENPELERLEIHKQLSDVLKKRLLPLKSFRFYQTSEIRSFIKTLEGIRDPAVREWIKLVERSVHNGDQAGYEALIKLID